MKKEYISTLTLILSVALIWPVPSGKVFASETCHASLANGFYDEYQRITPPLRDRAMYAELCALRYEDAQKAIKRAQQFGKDKSLGLTYGLVNLDDLPPDNSPDSGSSPADTMSDMRFGQWKGGYCAQNATLDPSQASEFFMQRAVAGNSDASRAVENWSACLRKRPGLTCWATPAKVSSAEQGEEFVLNVNWASSGVSESQGQPEVEYSYLTRGGVAKFEGVAASRILPDRYKLKAGTLQIPVTRPADKGVFATLKVSHAGTEHSCKVFVPGDRDFSLSEPFINRLKLKYPG
jgi:hypothetical protein